MLDVLPDLVLVGVESDLLMSMDADTAAAPGKLRQAAAAAAEAAAAA